jgi:hypothetical protein
MDDILVMSRTKEESIRQAEIVTKLLQEMGFTINIEKSLLTPSQTVEYLGFKIDSKSMTFLFPKRKIKDLIKECSRVKQSLSIPVRKLASLIGKITATTCAIFLARLRSRELLRTRTMV